MHSLHLGLHCGQADKGKCADLKSKYPKDPTLKDPSNVRQLDCTVAELRRDGELDTGGSACPVPCTLAPHPLLPHRTPYYRATPGIG